MKTTNSPSPFVGCWDTKWSVCNGGWAGVRLAIKMDAVNPAQLIGAWGGLTGNPMPPVIIGNDGKVFRSSDSGNQQ